MFYNGNVADEDEYLREDRWDLCSELLAQLSRSVYDIYKWREIYKSAHVRREKESI